MQKLRQTDKDFNFHSVSLLGQAPLECGSNALPSPCLYACARVIVVTVLQSVCLSVSLCESPFDFGEGAIFIHQYNLGDDLSPSNVVFS